MRAHEIIHRLHLDEEAGIETALAIAAFAVIIVAFYFLSFAVGGALQP